MLLILTSTEDQTADYLCGRLDETSVQYIRLDTERYQCDPRVRFSPGEADLEYEGRLLRASDVSHLWFRRPRRLRISRSADDAENAHLAGEAAEALEGFLAHITREKWMNHPAFNSMASHKMEQLSRASRMGLRIPRSLVSVESLEVDAFRGKTSSLIAKPLASGWLERVDAKESSIIYTSDLSDAKLESSVVSGCPTLYQERIEKRLDVRVTVVDEVVSGVGLRNVDQLGRQVLDIRRDNMFGVEYSSVDIPAEIARSLIDLVASYSLRFGAIDMAIDRDSSWVFFELNPNGQWAWLDLVGGAEIWRSFATAFQTEST